MSFDSGELPSHRAILTRSDLTIVRWWPNLLHPGPCGEPLDRVVRKGIAVADLVVLDDGDPPPEELIVRFLVPGSGTPEARDRLADWAELVGYRRVWLPDELRALDPAARPVTTVATRCRTCSATWRDGSPDFWAMVRNRRLFPDRCRVCGSTLPQWRPVARSQEAASAAAGDVARPAGVDHRSAT